MTTMTMTLNQIRRTTTPEYLGTEATQADVESYLALLAQNWPTDDADEAVDVDAADQTQGLTFKVWSSPRVEWSQADSESNVSVSDGEETYFARVPSDWNEARVATAFLSTYEVLPEVAREWGSRAAFLRDLRGKLKISLTESPRASSAR